MIQILHDDLLRYQGMLSELMTGTHETNNELISSIKKLTLDHNALTTLELTLRISRLLTKKSYVYSVPALGESHWRNCILSTTDSSGMMMRAMSVPNPICLHVFELFENDYQSTRETVRYLDRQTQEHSIPYLAVFIKNALKNIYGYRGSEVQLELIERLFGADKPLIKWCESVIAEGKSLKSFGGLTNTKLGLIHRALSKFSEAKNNLIEPSDYNIDLGGGFATPEVSQTLGRPFTCYDLNSPIEADRLGLQFKINHQGSVYPKHLSDYMNALNHQDFRIYDVFKDPLPDAGETYNITSMGFLNSNVGSLSKHQPHIEYPLKNLNTMFCAIYRIVELASKGKRICLISLGRPHFPYMNRLVLIKFSDLRVTDVIISKDKDCFKEFNYEAEPSSLFSRAFVRYFATRFSSEGAVGRFC